MVAHRGGGNGLEKKFEFLSEKLTKMTTCDLLVLLGEVQGWSVATSKVFKRLAGKASVDRIPAEMELRQKNKQAEYRSEFE